MIEKRTEWGAARQEKVLQERDLLSDSVDDARRLYVKNKLFVRTDSKKECEQKKAGKTTERRKAPRLSDRRFLREFRVGSPERLYER